jgi:hypothetical protein
MVKKMYRQYNGKEEVQTIQWPLLYPLYCRYLFFTIVLSVPLLYHCIVCTSSLPIVLSVPLLYHCIVCTSSLPLYCLYLFFNGKEEVQTIQWEKKMYRQYNGKEEVQTIQWERRCTDNTMGKEEVQTIVCTSSLPIVLSVPLLYPLYCLYLFFTHCIVCTSSLPLYCLYLFFTHCIEVQTIQWVTKRYRQYNG